ncbi:GntR family transcriptional regulator [Schleiferilactobacillus shenzhenensis]|uniref:HTH gntR-type domain-containing protein n=1 Tax=Schleiferilactobacillus shenzhenensis LY-73 TaxID=1231336 RepID=U4TSS1_9LACO|nr:GntR family transcriptional regulator [Schleiferilactobacillus shenzhenensis]ERL64918.1 hypothetical protein L248_0522 [Schleiferilactobacillus shenzhenensis LY-73]
MQFAFNDTEPLFQQVTDQLAALILSGAVGEGEQLPSTTEIAGRYHLNPATVLKGVNQLVDQGLAYKQRGIGMFVQTGARAKLQAARRTQFVTQDVAQLVRTARQLGLTQEQVIDMIESGYSHAAD